MITVGEILKSLAKKKQRRKHLHKTRYGKHMGERWGYDKKAHMEEYQRLRNQPFNPSLWWKE